ncbi:ABC transporter ATP-binding protein [Porphyrobacter sp. YT40]|uniref:ABC transporter ATP-binding protein n=1 Tax=Porphyrobacter sp. YT40 TaxID=2547601 RepID=UPI001141D52C|nr:ABC transporter ATP-binding protein [Porphyrobacter sp. YT40]QDH33860.1 ABC transporter ATP-binding protein [Porphyrobacter sp. YT40]
MERPQKGFGALGHWARRHRGSLALIGGISLLGSLATLALPWLAARLAAGIAGNAVIDLSTTLWLLGAALAGLTAATIGVTILSEQASGRILAELRDETYAHIQALPVSFHDSHRQGDLLSLMSYEVQNLSSFLTATLAQLPAMMITAVGAVVLMFLIDPAMALVVPALVPLFYVGMKLLSRRLRDFGAQVRAAEVDVLWQAGTDLDMLPAIKAFAVEDEHYARYAAAVERARLLKLRQTRITAFISPVVTLVAALGAIGILLAGNASITSGTRSPGDLFAFLFYAALLTRPVGSLAGTYGAWQLARGALERLEAVLAMPPEPGYGQPQRPGRARGAIAFEQVAFAYPDRPPLLSGFDLAIAPGEIVALTGANGVGKSTLVNLLLRFYEPTAGRITLDGSDIAALDVKALRRQFGFVPQRALLLDGTIAENIAFGLAAPDPAAIEQAARWAQAWDFIEQLPEGLATMIGDDGVRLSGGQRQRIALARALLRDPPIYIFDEATSMYDLDGEAAFVEDCITTLAGRTVIIITHRPASLALADRIIELTPSGPVVATGASNGKR